MTDTVENEQTEAPVARRLTDDELKQLALDVDAGQIFGSWGAPVDMWPAIFMPLMLMGKDEIKKLLDADVVVFYERLEKAGPRSINGYPVFFGMNYLVRDDFKRLQDIARAIQDAKSAALAKI